MTSPGTFSIILCIAVVGLTPSALLSAARLSAPDVVVGQYLAAPLSLALSEPALAGGLQITLTSENPAQVLLSNAADAAGSASIFLTVPGGRSRTPEFYVFGLGSSGNFKYLATAPGCDSGRGSVALRPSAVVIRGASGLGNSMLTVIGGGPSRLQLYSALLDSSGEFEAAQQVAGGHSVHIRIDSSNPEIGVVRPDSAVIPAGSAGTTVDFEPASPGRTVITATAPGFNGISRLGTIPIMVVIPGISVTDQVAIGRDLQIQGTLSLGQPAPARGLRVTLTSSDPKALLLSLAAQEIGSRSINIDIPAGKSTALYHLQALAEAGAPTYTASAAGYISRTGTIHMTPSGVVIGLQPPDEAELFRKEAAEEKHGFTVSLSRGPNLALTAYTLQLDPATLRGADITVQALRPGISVTAQLNSSDPSVGSIGSPVNIPSGSSSASVPFLGLKEGMTVISVSTPGAFTAPRNATSLIVLVTP